MPSNSNINKCQNYYDYSPSLNPTSSFSSSISCPDSSILDILSIYSYLYIIFYFLVNSGFRETRRTANSDKHAHMISIILRAPGNFKPTDSG